MVEISSGMIELILTFIILPWCVFITMNVFALRQQFAVLKAELSVLHEIKTFLKERK